MALWHGRCAGGIEFWYISDAVKDGHTAADTTEVTETSEDALSESAEVLEHAYHGKLEC